MKKKGAQIFVRSTLAIPGSKLLSVGYGFPLKLFSVRLRRRCRRRGREARSASLHDAFRWVPPRRRRSAARARLSPALRLRERVDLFCHRHRGTTEHGCGAPRARWRMAVRLSSWLLKVSSESPQNLLSFSEAPQSFRVLRVSLVFLESPQSVLRVSLESPQSFLRDGEVDR